MKRRALLKTLALMPLSKSLAEDALTKQYSGVDIATLKGDITAFAEFVLERKLLPHEKEVLIAIDNLGDDYRRVADPMTLRMWFNTCNYFEHKEVRRVVYHKHFGKHCRGSG